MIQLLLHLWGDFIVQTDTQAKGKKLPGRYGAWCCLKHVTTYSIPFAFIAPSVLSWLVIFITHFIIDRTKIIDYLLAIKNGVYKDIPCTDMTTNPPTPKGTFRDYDISNFGFSLDRPFALSIWLYIAADNICHITINYLALRYL